MNVQHCSVETTEAASRNAMRPQVSHREETPAVSGLPINDVERGSCTLRPSRYREAG